MNQVIEVLQYLKIDTYEDIINQIGALVVVFMILYFTLKLCVECVYYCVVKKEENENHISKSSRKNIK